MKLTGKFKISGSNFIFYPKPFDAGVKAWIQFNGTGTIAIQDSFNVDSIVDNGTGDYRVDWDTDFANSDFPCVGSASYSFATCAVLQHAVGSIRIITWDANLKAARDDAVISVIAPGDQ